MAGHLPTVVRSQHVYLLGLAFLMIFVGLSFKIGRCSVPYVGTGRLPGGANTCYSFLKRCFQNSWLVILIRIVLVVY